MPIYLEKLSKLKAIQADAQVISEAISAIIELDTVIVDETLMVVAGTGRFKKRVGYKEEDGDLHAGYLYGRVITKGKSEIVEDAPNDPLYDPSVQSGPIDELAEICCPIIGHGKTLGVIGMVAVTEEQRQYLLSRKRRFMEFVLRMGQLLASNAIEADAHHNNIMVTNQLCTIIESIDNAMLSVDKNGTIMHCNQIGANLIRRNKRDIIGRHISRIWPGSPILSVLDTGAGYNWHEESYQSANHAMEFMVTVNAVVSGSDVVGAVASFRDVAEVRQKAYDMIVTVPRVGVDSIWGESLPMHKLRETVLQVAQSNANVLITGETGTGKGLVSSAIHHSGPRLAGPFIPVNCGAIPDNLIESELFGYREGAFSGAKKGGKPGKFELAHNGTIFLDEIGDMPLRLQPKLLHILQTKMVERLGGVKPIPANARVIASTNRDLESMITENEFRNDLFFRLNVIPIHVPPLRARTRDMLMLLERFLEKYCRNEGKLINGVSEDVKDLFVSYRWPGNVRELENTVEYMASMTTQDIITMDSVPARIKRQRQANTPSDMSLDALLQNYEKNLLLEKLDEIGNLPGRIDKLADSLHVSRATLYRKLKKLGIQ
ncbi:MAG: sigma 54-interacting transcriptional regulator [Deltaproteobacteria bacterium]|nr:sigma 54-interacting transcriptional regulator [Deltaproteobacteria bacterium]